jgi:dTDP-4-amino-4,6-dideoxygalactose transaminase
MDYDIFICDHDSLSALSNRTGIPILHDAAHSFGSKYNEVPIGNQHQYTMFSFDPVKTITCIDGGAVILRGEDEVKRLHAKRLIGMTQSAAQMYTNSRAWTYDMHELGFRYHMANLHAAIGVAQLNKLDEIRSSRQNVCKRYCLEFADKPIYIVPNTNFNNVNPFLFYIRVLNGHRDSFREHLQQCGIDTGIHWQAGHEFSYLRNCRSGPLSVTKKITNEIVSIPLHSKMHREDVTRVIAAVNSFQV